MNFVHSIFIAIIVVFGSIGNIISLIVWHNGQRCRNTSSAVYFKILATVDIFTLVIIGTENFIRLTFLIFIQDYHDVLCRLVYFFEDSIPQVSACLVVAISIERTLKICFPLRFYNEQSGKRPYIVFILILISSTCLNILSLVTPALVSYSTDWASLDDGMAGIVDEGEYEYGWESANANNQTEVLCDFPEEYRKIRFLLSTISYALCTFLLPFIAILTCNVLILLKICRGSGNVMPHEIRRKRIQSVTRIVISIGVVHCVSTFPRSLNWFLFDIGVRISQFFTIEKVGYVCFFLNSALNCVVYCLFGDNFRKDLIELIGCRRLEIGRNSSKNESKEKRTVSTILTS